MATYNAKCSRCGESPLGWQQNAKGRWLLHSVFLDRQIGEVLGGVHDCKPHFEFLKRQAEVQRVIEDQPRLAAEHGEAAIACIEIGNPILAAAMAKQAATHGRRALAEVS